MAKTRQERLRSAAWISVASFAAVLAILHVLAIFTENVNWDEFGLLFRGVRTLDTGQLHGGGRPGLAVLALLPFTDDCSHGVSAVRWARLLWTVVTFLSVAGLFFVLRNSIPRGEDNESRWHRAAFAVAFLVLVPVWLRWSIQVRTDQLALVLTLWGGVCLLASKNQRTWLALVAGFLMMLGYFATQKGVYVSALVGTIVLGHHLISMQWSWKRELTRAALMLIGAGLAYASFQLGVRLFFDPATPSSIKSSLNLFKLYKMWLRFRIYKAMLPTLWPHMAFLVVLLATTLWVLYERTFRRTHSPRVTRWQELVVAWAIFALGMKVMYFHAAAFPYFWLTLGLFPAAAVYFACGPAAQLAGKPSIVALVSIGVWSMLALPSLGQAISLTTDTQEIQRASLDFVERNFERRDQGFHPESALLCRDDPDPFQTLYSEQIERYLRNNPQNRHDFIESFRTKPVKFIVKSYRLSLYPPDIRHFWSTHYFPYWPGVDIPGFVFSGPANREQVFDSFVDGTYQWRVFDSSSNARLLVDGTQLAPNDVIVLTTGVHTARFVDDVHGGVLVYKIKDDWDLSWGAFYSLEMREELEGEPIRVLPR